MASNPRNMDEGEFIAYLAKKGITDTIRKVSDGEVEIYFDCPFSGCDDDSRPNEKHCSFNLNKCVYNCWKCGQKGNYIDLLKYFGDYEDYCAEQKAKRASKAPGRKPKLETVVQNMLKKTDQQARDYFKSRGLNDESIDKYMLGYWDYDGRHGYMIPIRGGDGQIAYVKLRRTREDEQAEMLAKSIGKARPIPKYTVYPTGAKVVLVGADELKKSNSTDVLVCEGELDRIIAIQEGVKMPVVTGGGGAQTFKDEWLEQLEGRRNIYLCFDNDDAGESGVDSLARRLVDNLPEASIFKITLPFEEGSHGDLTDYFVQKRGTADELFTKYAKYHSGAEPIDASKFKEISVDDVAKILDLTIVDNYANKIIIFLAMLLAYTEEEQLTVMLNARSSTGKTYLVDEVSSLFPLPDIHRWGKTSPKAIYYNPKLTKVDDNGDRYIDLERSIIIFSEQQGPETLENMRAFLSHDSKKTPFMLVNKEGNKNTAPEGYLLGYASTFFCSANMRIDEQEQTRSFILSPKCSEETVRAAITLSFKKNSDKKAYLAWLNSDEDRKLLKDRILYIKSLHVDQINIEDEKYAEERYCELMRAISAPAQRKSKHFTSLAKGIALLNAPYRMKEGVVVATKKDVDEAVKIWKYVCESMFYGIPPEVLDFYKNYILPVYLEANKTANDGEKLGVVLAQICMYYYDKTKSWPNGDMVNKMYIPILEGISFIECKQVKKAQGGDGRQKYIVPKVFFDDDLEEKR